MGEQLADGLGRTASPEALYTVLTPQYKENLLERMKRSHGGLQLPQEESGGAGGAHVFSGDSNRIRGNGMDLLPKAVVTAPGCQSSRSAWPKHSEILFDFWVILYGAKRWT